MRKEASFRIIFKKVRASNKKLEIDDPRPPWIEIVPSHYEEGEAPVKFVSTVEEHYHHV